MKIRCTHDELIEPHKLQPHPKNPNKHPSKQIDRLAKIIDYQGQRSPIVVSKRSGFIVVGHGRLMAMQKLGWDKVAVDYQDFNDEAEEYAHLTADNAISEWASLDLSGINAELGDLGPDLDLEMLGIENFELEPSEKEKPLSKEGWDDEQEDDRVDIDKEITIKIHYNKFEEKKGTPWTVHTSQKCFFADHINVTVPSWSVEKPDKQTNPRYFIETKSRLKWEGKTAILY